MILYNQYVPGLIGLQLTTKWDHTFFCTPKLLHQSLGYHTHPSSKRPSAISDNVPGCCLLSMHSGEGAQALHLRFSPSAIFVIQPLLPMICQISTSPWHGHPLQLTAAPPSFIWEDPGPPILLHSKDGQRPLMNSPKTSTDNLETKLSWFKFRAVRKNAILTKV